jgi:hypothetical protein
MGWFKSVMTAKIPAATIGLLSQILPNYYTHAGLEGLFLTASAPDNIPDGSKPDKVATWLRLTNQHCEEPLKVLGNLLADFMDREIYTQKWYGSSSDEEEEKKRNEAREKIVQSLAKDGLKYSRGGHIAKGSSVVTISLQQSVAKLGLPAVEIEIQRALAHVDNDPLAAAHNAACALEASLKAYLSHYGIPSYKEESDTLSDLWKQVIEHIGIKPKELDDKDLKKIASGLFNIVDGTMHLRNKKSAAHGKSEEQLKQNTIRPRHARLAIHAAYTISAYILEFIEN